MQFGLLITFVKNVSETVKSLSKQILNTHLMCIDHTYLYAVIYKFEMKLVFFFRYNLSYIIRKTLIIFLILRNTICGNDNRLKTLLFVVVNLLNLLARAVLLEL